jgi:hypothetical protein
MSCLFHSLGQLLKIPTDTVRQQICDYLQADKPILDGMETHDVLALEGGPSAAYIQRMRQSSTWGGAIEIQAAVRIWNVCVTVQNRRDRTAPIEFVTADPTSVLVLYWTGGHYEPVSITGPPPKEGVL